MKKSTKLLFLVLCIISALNVKSQTDNEFWFAAPDISNIHGSGDANGSPLYLHISAVYATTVIIDRPSDPSFTAVSIPLEKGATSSLRLDNLLPNVWTDIEVDAAGGVQSEGFLITSFPGEITCTYDLDNYYNREFVTLKGANALGEKFTVTTQDRYPNGYTDARSGFVVVATESNTTVTVDLPAGIDYVNHPATGVRPAVITLPNAGDAYNFQVLSNLAAQHPMGVVVTSDEDIAVTVYDDSMARDGLLGSGGCVNMYCEQLVADEFLGYEYVVMKGHLGDPSGAGNSRTEFAFATALKDNTDIYIDDVYDTTLNSGGVVSKAISAQYTKVRGSNPISVTQITGTGGGCEQGGAQLPAIDACTGSYSVNAILPNLGYDFAYLKLMVRTNSENRLEAINSFELVVDGDTSTIPASYFEFPYAPEDSTFAFLIDDWDASTETGTVFKWFNDKLPNDTTLALTISNKNTLFHFGVLQGGTTNGAKYGYFSDYAGSNYSAGLGGAGSVQMQTYCSIDSFQVAAQGGVEYTWSCMSNGDDVSNQLSDVKDAAPNFYPDTTGYYYFNVLIEGECGSDTIISLIGDVKDGAVADFTISEYEACSPFSPLITNTTDSANVDEMLWTITSLTDTITQEMPTSFTYDFVNNSDTTQYFYVELYTSLPYSKCIDLKVDTLTVRPQMDTTAFNFTELSSSCEGKTVLVENTSILDDESSFVWNFGDGTTSTDMDVEYSYARLAEMDIAYALVLKSTNTYGCVDSTVHVVELPQMVYAEIEADITEGCSPLAVSFTNTSGGETEDIVYSWKIKDSEVATTENMESVFTNYSLYDDSVYTVQLIVSESDLCSDTASSTILVHPTPIASFELTPSEGTAPLEVSFTNYSVGADVYSWDFGTGETSNETNPVYTYNPDSSMSFVAILTASSDWCEESFSKTVNVLVEPSSIHTLIDDENINYFYNSKFEELMVELDLNESSTLKLSVYNLLGSLVIEKEIQGLPAGNNQESVSMQGEQDGVFILRLQVNEKITSGIFIKK